jgi:putative transposase
LANARRAQTGASAARFSEVYWAKILRKIKENNSSFLSKLLVNAKDRRYQVWERNALSFPLVSPQVIDQKFNYIHDNPVKAGLCKNPWDNKYSSAAFYYHSGNDFGFLVAM